MKSPNKNNCFLWLLLALQSYPKTKHQLIVLLTFDRQNVNENISPNID